VRISSGVLKSKIEKTAELDLTLGTNKATSNPAMDHQVRIALRDDQKAEKFATRIADLATQMVNATFKFAEDVKSAYESEAFPKRRRDDRNFDETDHAKLALGAFSYFHASSRPRSAVYGY
jgi:hypothetical protein